MQTVRWLTFCVSNALTRTVVHFFPSAGTVTAPYPATYRLNLFGAGFGEKRVVLEGARLSQPDGVRLEEAFPVLATQGSGTYGLSIEVTTAEPRVDLSGSLCVIEFSSKGRSLRFMPKLVAALGPDEKPSIEKNKPAALMAAWLKDSYHSTSLLVVNGSTDVYQPKLLTSDLKPGSDRSQALVPIALNPVASRAVMEYQAATPSQPGTVATLSSEDSETDILNPALAGPAEVIECSWGLLRSRPLQLIDPGPQAQIGHFLVFREGLTKRPVSVVAF